MKAEKRQLLSSAKWDLWYIGSAFLSTVSDLEYTSGNAACFNRSMNSTYFDPVRALIVFDSFSTVEV